MIFYIIYCLDEVLEIVDWIVGFCDGCNVGGLLWELIMKDVMIKMMVGCEIFKFNYKLLGVGEIVM